MERVERAKRHDRRALQRHDAAFPKAATLRSWGRIDPGNAKLRELVGELIDDGLWRLVWMPPTLPYWPLEGPFEGKEHRLTQTAAGVRSRQIGQEGLDFHPWCHRLVHWNLPGNPVDLEQREGRIHRYMGHSVRRYVAAAHAYDAFAAWSAGDDIWKLIFELANKAARAADISDLGSALDHRRLLRAVAGGGTEALGGWIEPCESCSATGPHSDPFDRMFIAQALAHDLAIVSNDRAFDRYGVYL